MPPVSALSIAAYFVELAGENNENDLTNLKLQKLLYFAQCDHLKKHGEPLFSDTIEAWPYGPVVPAVYDAYKSCGAFPITVFDAPEDVGTTEALENDTKTFVRTIWDRFGRFSASYLVSLTHQKNGPWDRVFHSPFSSKAIPIELLISNQA